jgi:uncharacterized repeat protein (TIGR03803 family)
MRARDWTLVALAAGAVLWLAPTSAPAQPATPQLLTLDFLNKTNGLPQASLIQASDGNLYGTSTAQNGAILRLTPAGTLTTLYTFSNAASGAGPESNLVQGSDGNLYGTTTAGGAYYNGTAFKISLAGTFTLLASFPANPCQIFNSALIQGSDGNFYGTTTGGANCAGTLYRMTPAGQLSTLYTFSGPDGALPGGALLQVNGTFYGTTVQGGANNAGVVFSITPSGTFKTLLSFNGTNGAWPAAALVLGTDGNLYGTTSAGGAANAGTVFKITTAGSLTTLYSFSGNSDGFAPNGLLQGSDGNFYGTTSGGGANGCPMLPPGACGANVSSVGTIFDISASGSFATLYSFAIADGQNPSAALVQASNGDFYGTTAVGGLNNFGTVFEFGLGIGFPPVNLKGSVSSSGVVTLSWDSPNALLQPPGSPAPTGYNVYAANSWNWQNNGGFNPQPLATVTSTSTTLSNLAPGTTYYFAVAWSDASGTSGLSNVVTLTTPGSPAPPYWHWGGGALGPWLLAALLLALLWRACGAQAGAGASSSWRSVASCARSLRRLSPRPSTMSLSCATACAKSSFTTT